MNNIKHIGRLKNNKRRVVVAYRTIPGDPYSCLVVFTEALSSDEHDTLMKLVESASGQQANELADAMFRSYLPDGRNMLVGFHQTGRLQKIATKDVEMTPNINAAIGLDELNQIIAQQRGVSLEDLAGSTAQSKAQSASAEAQQTATAMSNDYVEDAVTISEEPLTDEALAAKYRSDADRMYKEAKRLRELAEELSPTKKKPAKNTESV
jgi:hypothetical protein